MKMSKRQSLWFSFIIFFLFSPVTLGYKILIVFPMPANSHYNLGSSLAKGLVAAGHDITMIAYYEEKNPPKGGTFTNVLVPTLGQAKETDLNLFDLEDSPPVLGLFLVHKMGNFLSKTLLEHENVKKLLASNQTFDAVIMEQFCNDAMKVLGWYYGVPVIIFSTVGANYWVNPLVGNPYPISYIPDVNLDYTENMTLLQRFNNVMITLFQILNNQVYYLPAQRKILREAFPDSPSLEELMMNVSLVLLNAHESTNQPVPLVPNMVNVGGMHINPGSGLPKDLQAIMDNANEGIIYFSMGSNIDPSKMKNGADIAIFNALGKLPYKVLMKWDKDVPEKSKNIIIRKWFPQQDVLAHPNVKLFITHGGLLSTLETVYYGVPVLTLPVFGDQKMNAAKAKTAGYGVSLAFSKLTEDTFSNALNEILNNKKYTENAKLRSSLMRDRIVKPIDTAVYWVEYVIRTKGAHHLRVAGTNMPFYQYFLLDIIAISLLSISVMVAFVYFSCKWLCSRKTNKIKFE